MSVGGPKPSALLAVLALDVGRVVSVDRLVEELWSGTPPETATHAVQVYVSQVRKALGGSITRKGPGYVLEVTPDAIDAHHFRELAHQGHEELRAGHEAHAAETLRAALALWRGPALGDFAYEPFAQAEIARLDDLRFNALENRIAADLALGRHAELLTEIEALIEAQPFRERPRALLMRALYLAGRQADALSAYRAAREMLAEELGVEPGPELRQLEGAILRHDESLIPAIAETTTPVRTRRVAAVLSVALAEREDLDVEAEEHGLEELADTAAATALRHGGISSRLADGSLIAVFGVPIAHEDDPLRAARAALEIREAFVASATTPIVAAIDVGEVSASGGSASGPPVRLAARLRLEAPSGDILVSSEAGRRIGHAARLERKGAALALLGLAAAPHAFERRVNTPFVGRKEQLVVLRGALRESRLDTRARGVLIVGGPGVGKSRLAEEFARRLRGARTLWGRCLSYGDGITFWPVREMLGQASRISERDAAIDALDAETPPSAAEIALHFRRLCEAMAREQTLILVFDDLHWAGPTLLDLVDHVVARGRGHILVVCLGREELVYERPGFLKGRVNVEHTVLAGLSSADTETLLGELDESSLGPDVRAQLIETAEGNPFFLEQMVALAREGGLVERALPETVRALASARLDRLGPGERTLLERSSVVGREFTRDDVVALLEPTSVPTTNTHLETLLSRGFLQRRADQRFGFRHTLIHEAVYRSTSKRLRADLHERFADRLEHTQEGHVDLEKFIGYHLEQAHRLRIELGESGRQVEALAEDAGRRLGAAGFLALKRGDMPAAATLLGRATTLLSEEDELRYELMCELGIALNTKGEGEGALMTLEEAIAGAKRTGSNRVELRARIEAAYARLLTDPAEAARELLATAEDAIPTLEVLHDDRSLARAWLLLGYVRGGILGDHAAWKDAEERALDHYRKSAFPPATCMQQIAAATYWGPTPVSEAIERCGELLADETIGQYGRAVVLPYLGGLHAHAGRFAPARELVTEAELLSEELGALHSAVIHCGTVRADIELLAEDFDAAERTLREQCEFLERMHDRSHLAVRAAKLADAIVSQGNLDEAERWAAVARANASRDDLSVQLVLGPVEARLLAGRGAVEQARERAEETVRLADDSDGLNQTAAARLALAEVLRAAGLVTDARRAIEEAIELFERKESSAGATRALDLLASIP